MNFRHYFDITFPVYSIAAVCVFGLIVLWLSFVLVRYRAGRGHEPAHKDKYKSEYVYIGVLFLIASCLAGFAGVENSNERAPLGKPALTVDVTAFRWCWSFHYAGTPVTVVANCDPAVPVLVLPKGQIVRVDLTSHDVVHEFWVPAFRWKEEAFPAGRVNVFEMRTNRIGKWAGECSTYCGLFHFRMDFAVQVVSVKAFNAFLHAHGTPVSTSL